MHSAALKGIFTVVTLFLFRRYFFLFNVKVYKMELVLPRLVLLMF